MKTIAVSNHKGGVGKTTIALHLAWLAMEQGKRVLMVELDSQRNASSSFPTMPGNYIKASELFAESIEGRKLEQTGGLSLIRADDGLEAVSINPDISIQIRPASHLRSLAADYDLCIIDVPPPRANPLWAAMIAANYVIAPIKLDSYSLDGVKKFHDTINRAKRNNRSLKFLGMLPNAYKAVSKLQREGLDVLAGANVPLLPITISDRVAVAEAAADGVPVWHKPRSAGHRIAATEMKAACEYILKEVVS